MFSSTRPSSQSYQVAAVCGEPSGRSVATTAGFGFARNSSSSGGTGTDGTPENLRGRGERRRLDRLIQRQLANAAKPNDDERAPDHPTGPEEQVPAHSHERRDRPSERIAGREEHHRA